MSRIKKPADENEIFNAAASLTLTQRVNLLSRLRKNIEEEASKLKVEGIKASEILASINNSGNGK